MIVKRALPEKVGRQNSFVTRSLLSPKDGVPIFTRFKNFFFLPSAKILGMNRWNPFHSLDVKSAALYIQASETWRMDNNLFIQFQRKLKGKKAPRHTIARWMQVGNSRSLQILGKRSSLPIQSTFHSFFVCLLTLQWIRSAKQLPGLSYIFQTLQTGFTC